MIAAKLKDFPMNEIIPFFEKSIFDPTIADVGIDITEIGIDSLINNPIVQSLPIAKAVIGVAKTAQNIHDRNLLLQTCAFIVGFNSGTIDEEKVQKYKSKVTDNSKYAEAELGRILIILNKTVEKEKSVIQGRLFRAYINEEINWYDFCELSEATESLYISDIPVLMRSFNERIENPDPAVSYRTSRLNALGLVIVSTADAKTTVGTIHIGSFVTISEFGKKYIKYGLKKRDEQTI